MIEMTTAAFLLSLFLSGSLTLVMLITDRYRSNKSSFIKYISYFILLFVTGFLVFDYYLGAEENNQSNQHIITIAGPIQYDAESMSWSKLKNTSIKEMTTSNAENFIPEKATADAINECMRTPYILTIAGPIYYDVVSGNWIEFDANLIKNNLDGKHKPITELDKQIIYHYQEASGAFNKANKLCVLIPEEKRHIAQALFAATVQASLGAFYGKYPGLITSLVLSLTEYGVFVCEQCHQIKEALESSEYHYQMWVYYMRKKEEEQS